MKKINKAFTLIELIVVISIISVLASIVLAGVGSAPQKRARDSKRRNDLGQYRIALENYAAANNGKYVGLAVAVPFAIQSSNLCSVSTAYSLMNYTNNACLVDSKQTDTSNHQCTGTNTDYNYCYAEDGASDGATADSYLLFAKLEISGYWVVCSNGKQGESAALPAGWTCPL